jgi:hypothetical protein
MSLAAAAASSLLPIAQYSRSGTPRKPEQLLSDPIGRQDPAFATRCNNVSILTGPLGFTASISALSMRLVQLLDLIARAPEQEGALPQSRGLARCGRGGTQESRRRVSLPHAQSDAQAGSPLAGQASQSQAKLGSIRPDRRSRINAAICGEPPGPIRSCKSPAAITAKWVSGLRGRPS